ncbi:PilZ domain-containing protein [Rhizobium sp. SG2393]|uniref:PilZ domain-containing protein n=1 Tax=Rhizobium sp. SG2393 TaxID=3276279 RepID=UPI00366C9CA7
MQPKPFDPRSRKRVLTMFACVARSSAGAAPATVMNLSTEGLCLRNDGAALARVGDRIEVASERVGRLSGTVYWRRGDTVGVRLDRSTNTAAKIESHCRAYC